MIILRDPNDIEKIEAFTTLTELCRTHKWARYATLKEKKFPFTYKGWRFDKVKV